jgi:hypothetical protein
MFVNVVFNNIRTKIYNNMSEITHKSFKGKNTFEIQWRCRSIKILDIIVLKILD